MLYSRCGSRRTDVTSVPGHHPSHATLWTTILVLGGPSFILCVASWRASIRAAPPRLVCMLASALTGTGGGSTAASQTCKGGPGHGYGAAGVTRHECAVDADDDRRTMVAVCAPARRAHVRRRTRRSPVGRPCKRRDSSTGHRPPGAAPQQPALARRAHWFLLTVPSAADGPAGRDAAGVVARPRVLSCADGDSRASVDARSCRRAGCIPAGRTVRCGGNREEESVRAARAGHLLRCCARRAVPGA